MSALPMVLMSDEEVAGYGRRDDAGFGALRTERGLLPLVAMSVQARVVGVIASTELAQTFVNTTGTAIEATYVFPLPDRAAVHRFRMTVAGRVVDGVVEERGAAREQYDQAIAKGHRAAITEEDRAGVFTLRVGNLLAGESATITLSLVGPLPVDDGEITFQFPLVVAPRYMPGSALGGEQAGLGVAPDTELVPDASRISPPVRLPGCANPVRLSISVALEDHTVRDVASSLHAVTQTSRDARVVEVQPGERLDRDFILRWRVGGDAPTLTSSLVCADDADGAGGTFLLTLVPPSTSTVAAKPREVVFVIDRSGSMEGWKMVAARRAAARMIDTLTSRDRFCVIAFDDELDYIPGEARLVEATDRNRFRAVEGLAKLDARGGTELHAPMMQAATLLAGGHDQSEQVIVLVTDGQVGNEDQILRELAPRLTKTRMFALGIDQAVNAAFLRRLASAGGGLCELVESEDRLDAVMAKVHRRIGTPIATELVLQATGLLIDGAQTTPSKLPDVYAGAPVTILGRYRGKADANAAIELACTSMGDPLTTRIARRPEGAATASTWLSPSWARARIRDLEDRYAVSQSRELETEIVGVSKRYQVLSRFTAFLAVDRSEIANPTGKLHQVVQPVETPAGWASAPGPRPAAAMPVYASRLRAAPGGMPMAPPPAPAGGALGTVGSISFEAGVDESFDDELATGSLPTASPAMPAMPAPQARNPAPAEPARAKRVMRAAAREESKPEAKAVVAPGASAYLTSLGALARELDAQARGRADAAALRLLRQRLTEWIEDVRSVGGHDTLATAVDRLVKRLSAALAAGAALATEVQAIAAELATLATGGTPPAEPKKSRLAFWK